MAEHQPSCKQSCTQSGSLWRTEYTASTKAFGSNTVTVFKLIPLGTTHINALCIPITFFFIKAFTRTNTSAHWQKQPKQLPNIFEGTKSKPSQVHSSCVGLDPLQGTRQCFTEENLVFLPLHLWPHLPFPAIHTALVCHEESQQWNRSVRKPNCWARHGLQF